MKAFSICALALMGCSLATKLNLPSIGTSSNNNEYTPRSSRAQTSPTPAYASAGNGPMATPVVNAGPAPASYAWCNKAKGEGDVDRALTDDDPDRSIPAIVENLCRPDGDAKAKRNQLEARRQYWMQRMAMNEADWAADVPTWAAVSYSIRNTASVQPEEGRAWSTMPPVEQFAILSMKTGNSAALALQPGGKTYIADSLSLTQAGRIAYIEQCIHTNWDNEEKPVEWALCQPDIDALDATKFSAELRGDTKASPYDRMVVRVAWANLGPKLTAHAEKVNKLTAKDEAYGKMIEIAREAHKSWPAIAAARTQELATLRLSDDADVTKSKKAKAALAGCGAKSWTAFSAELGKLPAKNFADINNLENDKAAMAALSLIAKTPDTYLTALAYVACASEKDMAGALLAKTLNAFPGFRGPRTSTLSKLLIANVQPDRGKVQYSPYGIKVGPDGDFTHGGDGDGIGKIESITTTGDMMRVTFVKDMQDSDVCVSWRTSNRIWMIEPGGQVRYYQECTKREVKQFNYASKPVTFHKRFAAGVVKGGSVLVADGLVIASFPKPGVPAAVFGAPVK